MNIGNNKMVIWMEFYATYFAGRHFIEWWNYYYGIHLIFFVKIITNTKHINTGLQAFICKYSKHPLWSTTTHWSCERCDVFLLIFVCAQLWQIRKLTRKQTILFNNNWRTILNIPNKNRNGKHWSVSCVKYDFIG